MSTEYRIVIDDVVEWKGSDRIECLEEVGRLRTEGDVRMERSYGDGWELFKNFGKLL